MRHFMMVFVGMLIILLTSSFDMEFCKDKADDFYAVPGDCSTFYQCLNKETFWFRCHTGLGFDEKCKCCNWMDNVLCITSKAHAIESFCECPNGMGGGMYYYCNILVSSSIDCVNNSPCYKYQNVPNSVCDH